MRLATENSLEGSIIVRPFLHFGPIGEDLERLLNFNSSVHNRKISSYFPTVLPGKKAFSNGDTHTAIKTL